ncbi:hypothetical protein ACFFJX_02690 [Pseudarcicella hirudinis]|uniref:hypothetical protein n=1 Tax=Pseudarcicella hirudinis TaxID=1079859 RepID=UPI0035EE0C0C
MLSDDDGSNRDNIGISYLQIVGAYLKMKQMEKKSWNTWITAKGISKKFQRGRGFLCITTTLLLI